MALQSGFIKRIRDVMRMDAGINGDAQRIEQMVWMLFLKVYDAKEDDWELNEKNYKSIIPEECRWRNWAVPDKNGHAMTGDKLLDFVNNTLFPTLKELPVNPKTPVKKAIVKSTFEDANNYMKDGVYLRQVIDIIDRNTFIDLYAEFCGGLPYIHLISSHLCHRILLSLDNRIVYLWSFKRLLTPYNVGHIMSIKEILVMEDMEKMLCRTFIEVPIFSKRWAEIGLGEDELLALQILLLKDPQSGPVMEGTGGIRKVRFPLENRGKSHSVRVCYTDFEEYEVIYLITAFTKKEQENLSDEEKKVLKKLVKSLKDEVAANRGGDKS